MYSYEFQPERLRKARLYKSKSLEEISEEFKQYIDSPKSIKADSIRKWETGDSTPNAKQIGYLATILDVNIEYFFVENISMTDDTSKASAENDTLKRMAEQIETLQSKIVPDAKFDPLAHAVKTKKPLRELVETLTKLDESALLEARGLIHGYLFGQEKKAEREAEEKGRQNAG
jgi:transcriptional regulator with XRE-family HTH domain